MIMAQSRILLASLGVLLAAVLAGTIGFFVMTNRVDAPTIVKEKTWPQPSISDLIRIDTPSEGERVSSPLQITGSARGQWFFEASFPVRLIDADGKTFASGIAVANPPAGAEWMTSDFVPFKAELSFPPQANEIHTFLVFENDNPSGLQELKYEYRLSVILAGEKATPTSKCVVTGCSNHICAEESLFTTCEYKPEYACYRSAVCERQTSGECGWTESPVLSKCLKNARENQAKSVY